MIWNDSSMTSGTDLEMLTEHIADEIRSAGPGNQAAPETPDSNELARSVAEFVFCSEASQRSRRAEGILIPSDYLLVMTCRALWAVGQEQAARNLLQTKGPELDIPASYAGAIFGRGLFPCLGMHAALVRALHPSSPLWSVYGPCWMLNLRTVFSFLDTGLELTIWRIMHALVNQLAGLWDTAGGKGTLGLVDLRYVSAGVLGFPVKSKQGRKFALELISYCEQDLKMAAAERSWPCTPAVMNVGG